MTALTTTTSDGSEYTPVMFIGGRCYPMLTEDEPTTRTVSKAQRARERRALGLRVSHGWTARGQRR